ncbi:MAG: ankyrin repeat domain-containing protein [Rickettsiaceae bacterium]|nr:ankyrin repeat domain-containing protein [Rickettsiaceae bacterium]
MGNLISVSKVRPEEQTSLKQLQEIKNSNTMHLAHEAAARHPSITKLAELCMLDVDANGYIEGATNVDLERYTNPICTTPPLISFCKHGMYEFVELLLNKGANPNIISLGATPLSASCENGFPKIAKLLIDRGADPNIECSPRFTPLRVAVEKSNLEMVQLLINNGASPKVTLSYLNPFVGGYDGLTIGLVELGIPNLESSIDLQMIRSKEHTKEIFQYLEFPKQYKDCLHLIGEDGQEIPLNFEPYEDPYVLK